MNNLVNNPTKDNCEGKFYYALIESRKNNTVILKQVFNLDSRIQQQHWQQHWLIAILKKIFPKNPMAQLFLRSLEVRYFPPTAKKVYKKNKALEIFEKIHAILQKKEKISSLKDIEKIAKIIFDGYCQKYKKLPPFIRFIDRIIPFFRLTKRDEIEKLYQEIIALNKANNPAVAH